MKFLGIFSAIGMLFMGCVTSQPDLTDYPQLPQELEIVEVNSLHKELIKVRLNSGRMITVFPRKGECFGEAVKFNGSKLVIAACRNKRKGGIHVFVLRNKMLILQNEERGL